MKKLALLLVAAAVIGVVGCGGDDDAAGEQQTVASGGVPFDRAFIDAMVPHHQAAIEMAHESKDAGLSQAELVKIADDIIAAQQTEIDQMLEWREEWFGSKERESHAAALEVLGLSMAEAGMEQHGAMNLANADNVDQAFAEMMVRHHEGAIRMARQAEHNADHDEVKQLAGEIIVAQQREVEVMEPHAMGEHG
jgi:uncharacterized protein (DUF305 family)